MKLQKGFSVVGAAVLLVQPILTLPVQADGLVTGQVYLDTNINGVLDSGETGVEDILVTVYDTQNTSQGNTSTLIDGTYTLDVLGDGPYRVEFSNLPDGYYPSVIGAGNDSSIQFLDGDGVANFAVSNPANFCSDNAFLATSCYLQGDVDGDALVSFPYSYTSSLNGFGDQTNPGLGAGVKPTDWVSRDDSWMPIPLAMNNEIGTTYGLAYDQSMESIYTSSYVRRKSKLGDSSGESTGAIYKTSDVFGTPSTSVFVDLNSIYGSEIAGTNPHPTTTTDFNDDFSSVDSVGKVAFGDLEISQDGSTLYTVNLADKSLYAIPTDGSADSSTIDITPIPTNIDGCDEDDVRPFAIGINDSGTVYVGGVCSAESSQDSSELATYVWEFNGASFDTVLTSDLATHRGGESYQAWTPWRTIPDGELTPQIPQPMLSDIEFVGNDLILGFRDRYGDITPAGGYRPDQAPWPRGNGDILKADSNGDGTWSINGEFYPVENPGDATEDEGTSGGLAMLPGSQEIVTTAYDAVNVDQDGNEITANFNTGGIQKYNNLTGQQTGAYDVYLAAYQDTFGKTNGLGDLEVICQAAPIEIGNFVWLDSNSNGVQDPGEVPLSGVEVELYLDNQLLATATTNESGNYIFSTIDGLSSSSYIYNLDLMPNSAYEVRLPVTQDGLSGLVNTLNDIDSSVDGDARDSDGQLSGDYYISLADTDSVNSANHSVDFGFIEAPLGGAGEEVEEPDEPVFGGTGEGGDSESMELIRTGGLTASTSSFLVILALPLISIITWSHLKKRNN